MEPQLSFRAVCESLKFLPVRDVILSVRAVCGHWRKLAYSSEVLYSLLESEGIDPRLKVFAQFPDVQSAFDPMLKQHKFLYTVQARTVCGNFCRSVLLRVSVLSGKVVTVAVLDKHYCALKLKSNQVFLCGGQNEVTCSNAACIYDIPSRETRRLPSMSSGKTNCCLVEHGHHVYVLGGSCGYSNLTSAERFSFLSWEWEALPSLPMPLYHYEPAAVGDSIYLLAVEGWRGVLEFDLAQNVYRKRWVLPAHFDTTETEVTTFVRGGQWVLVSKGTALEFDLERPESSVSSYSVAQFTPLSSVLVAGDNCYLIARFEAAAHLLCLQHNECMSISRI